MDLQIAIVDDMDDDRLRLSRDIRALLAQKGCVSSILTFASAEEFLSSSACASLDIAFLDVRMDGMNGIELASRLRNASKSLIIVFVTSSREYALDAFPVHPFDYLVKPYTKERVAKVLEDILAALNMRNAGKSIKVDVPYGSVVVLLDRIIVIESRSHSSVITLEGGQETRSTFSFAEISGLVANESQFLVINRGVAINMDKVVSVEAATVVMEGGLRLPLRKRDRGDLTRAITQHMISRAGRRYRG